MRVIFSDEVKRLYKEIHKWTDGFKKDGDKYVIAFRYDTPKEIFVKYERYLELIKKEMGDDSQN